MMAPRFLLLAALCAWSCVPAWADDARLPRGKTVFDNWCFACHGPGIDKPGSHALAVKYERADPVALDTGPAVPEAVVRYFVRHGRNVMPPFRKTEITDAELADLSAYLARPR